MDIATLKQSHPDVYAAVVKEATDAERDRVCAHLTLGEKSGDLKTAFAAIRNGDGMTQTLTATYLAAGMNRRDSEQRQSETDEAGAAADGAPAAAEEHDLGDKIVAIMEKQRGAEIS